MAAEDEAVQLAFRTGTAAVQSASEIIKYLLEGLAQARRARAAGNRNDRIPARFARALTHGAANMVDGHGEKGIVSAETVRAQNPDQYREAMVFPGAVADNREDIQKLKRELMNHGVKFSVFDTVNPMDGSPAVSIGIQGRDMDIMTQALINIGVESFGMDRKELEECARGIERDDQNRYPRAFKRNGINWEFERTGDGRNSWVGSAGGHSREQYRVTLDPDDENKASFECTRNGRPVASAEVDATQGPELWKIGSDGAKEFYNEMKAEGAAFAAAPGMVLEAAIKGNKYVDGEQSYLDRAMANMDYDYMKLSASRWSYPIAELDGFLAMFPPARSERRAIADRVLDSASMRLKTFFALSMPMAEAAGGQDGDEAEGGKHYHRAAAPDGGETAEEE